MKYLPFHANRTECVSYIPYSNNSDLLFTRGPRKIVDREISINRSGMGLTVEQSGVSSVVC